MPSISISISQLPNVVSKLNNILAIHLTLNHQPNNLSVMPHNYWRNGQLWTTVWILIWSGKCATRRDQLRSALQNLYDSDGAGFDLFFEEPENFNGRSDSVGLTVSIMFGAVSPYEACRRVAIEELELMLA